MTETEFKTLVVFLTREVAKLHGLSTAYRVAFSELLVSHPELELDKLNLLAKQKEGLHEFYAALEDINPAFAALIDNREDDAF